jgi:uncharacterized protein YrrD
MREAKDILKLPVIAVDSGNLLGQVKELLFNPGKHQLYGMVVESKDDDRTLLVKREQIGSIGDHAVTIASKADISVLDADDDARQLLDSGGHLKGMDVVTERGDLIGHVDNVMINEDGSIARYHASAGLLGLGAKTDISPDEVVSAGEDAIIMPSADVPPDRPPD